MSGLQVTAATGSDILSVSFVNPLQLSGMRFKTQFVKKVKVVLGFSGGESDVTVSFMKQYLKNMLSPITFCDCIQTMSRQ